MTLSKLERLLALFANEQLPLSLDGLTINEEEEASPSHERHRMVEYGEIALKCGDAGLENLELQGTGTNEESLDSQHKIKSKETSVSKTDTSLGRHQWIHDPTKATRIHLHRHNASVGVASGEFTLDPHRGQLTAPGETFAPIVAISKFPYKFVNEDASQPIASAFFDEGKFWTREWDLYYIHPPSTVAKKPLILVPLHQVQTLLSDIHKTFFQFKPELSQEFTDIGLIVQFPDHPHIRPRFLGKSTSKAQFNFLEFNVPPHAMTCPSGEGVPPPDDRSFEAFERKVQGMLHLSKSRNKAAKAKRKDDRIKRQQEMARSLKRAQRYLGLRPKSQRESLVTKKFATWEEERDAFTKVSEQTKLPPIDVAYPSPYPFDNTVVFICIDVEVWEKDHQSITEIGVCTLDTLDLIGIPPGKNGINWEPKILKHHFRITENAHLENSKYVTGCAEKFEFGESEFICIHDAPAILASIFSPVSTLPSAQRAAHYTPPKYAFTSGSGERVNPPIRNVVLVGHDVNTDICYLRNLVKGFDPLFPNKTEDGPQTSPVIDTLDTAYLYRVLTHDAESSKLASLLVEFEIAGWNLHNAGNDAAYTMHAMLAIALRAAEGRKGAIDKLPASGDEIGEGKAQEDKVQEQEAREGKVQEEEVRKGKVQEEKTQEEKNEEALQERIKLAGEEAEQRVREAEEGWESDQGDGGAPLPLSGMSMAPKRKRASAGEKSSDGGVSLSKFEDVD